MSEFTDHPLTLRDWLTAQFPDPVWIIKDLMEAGTGGWLHGPPGAYKSFWLLRLCVDVAAGVDPLDTWPAQPAVPTLYLQAEGVKRGWQKRIIAAAAEVPESVPFHTVHDTTFKVDTPKGERYFRTLMDRIQPKLVVLDPLVTWFTGNDSDPVAIREWLDRLNVWRSEYDTALLVAHHDRQPHRYYNKVTGDMATLDAGVEEMRGRTELVGWADLQMGLKRKGDVATLKVHKARDEATGASYTFRLDDGRIVLAETADRFDRAVARTVLAGTTDLTQCVKIVADEMNMHERTARRKLDKAIATGTFELVGDGPRKALRIVKET